MENCWRLAVYFPSSPDPSNHFYIYDYDYIEPMLNFYFIDYAVDIFHHALKTGSFVSNLRCDTRLPMMYLPDVIKATSDLLDAPEESFNIRTYNIGMQGFTDHRQIIGWFKTDNF